MDTQQSSPNIQVPVPQPRAATVNPVAPHPAPSFGQNASAFSKHPWTNQIILALVMGLVGLGSGKFIWDENSVAIRELQYEVKEMRQEMKRIGEDGNQAKENALRITEIEKNNVVRDSDLKMNRKQIETLRRYNEKYLSDRLPGRRGGRR